MIDLLKELLPILVSGFLALNIFRYRTQYNFTKLSGEKYVMSLVAWGIAIHALWILVNIVRIRLGFINFEITLLEEEFIKLVFYVFTGALFGAVIGEKNILERIQNASTCFKSYKNPQTSTELESLLLSAIDSEDLSVFLIELDNDKIYVGLITTTDVKDDVPFEEKTLSIRPFMSGYRRDENSEVIYDHHYFSTELRKAFLGYNSSTQVAENLLSKFLEEYEKVEDIYFFQRRITSIRRFNAGLYQKFNNSTS
jgi:hypothetical protein